MTTLATTHLPLHTDCVAFCPAHPRLLAAAGYQLDPTTRTRAGGVWLFECGGVEGGDDSALDLAPAGSVDSLPGVFDAIWTPAAWGTAAPSTLALALSDGRVEARRVEGGEGGYSLRSVASVAPGGGGGDAASTPLPMALYLAHHPTTPGRTAVTLADGTVALLAWDAGGRGIATAATFPAHSLEAWTAAWCSVNPSILYTGGDDAFLSAWDVRTDCTTPAWRAPRAAHGAGVTSIAPAATGILATGSYDEHIRVWDVRWPAVPTMTADTRAGGGVWRLAWRDAETPRTLLAACMHASFVVARVAGGSVSITETYTKHGGDNLAYGAAWWVGGAADGGELIATASFYDSTVHVWRPATQDGGVCE